MTSTRTYFDNVLSHYDSIRKLMSGDICSPRFATLHLSNRCNHRCHGCAYGGQLDNEMMSEEDTMLLLLTLVNAGVRGFEFCGGGEPMTLPHLPKAIGFLILNQCSFGALTNGSLLNDTLIELFAKKGTYIRISMEASSQESYIQYTGTSEKEWGKVKDNIRRLVAAKARYGSSLDIGLKFGVGKSLRGFDHYRNGIDLAAELGVSNVQFKSMSHEPEELSENDKRQENLILRSCITMASLPVLNGILRNDPTPQCWLNPLHIVANHKGDAFLCCYYYFREDRHRLGNLLTDNFDDMWFSKRHQEMIRNIRREECDKVNCKFFRHHTLVAQAFDGGRIEFL